MQFEDFKDHTMVCNSTGIQPVNLLPALQFNCQRVMILSTKHTEDNQLRNSIAEIYHSVKTKKLNSSEKHDAEHDIVIVTKFGTLILIELKTYEFSGDLAQAQQGLAYKKSGPYHL